MPFALYSGTLRVSEPFVSEDDLWDYVRHHHLCLEVIDREDLSPQIVLDPKYEIHTCALKGERPLR
ncbi:MAG: hypothetical protein AB1586_31715 [Pseudomonadota bacterium]